VKNVLLNVSLAALGLSLLLPCYGAAPAKIAAVAPVAILVGEADARIKLLDEHLASNENYIQAKGKKIPDEAAVLTVLAQAIVESDEKAAWQSSAADVRDAAKALGAAKSYDEAKAALAAIKEAHGGKKGSAKPEYEWNKLAKLGTLMNAVSARNNKFRRVTKKKDPTDAEAAEYAGDAAVSAVLALAIAEDTHEVKSKKQDDIDLWKKFAKDFQTQMSAASAAYTKKDVTGAADAWKKSSTICNDCHGKFKEGE
jgi:hypothetical protein